MPWTSGAAVASLYALAVPRVPVPAREPALGGAGAGDAAPQRGADRRCAYNAIAKKALEDPRYVVIKSALVHTCSVPANADATRRKLGLPMSTLVARCVHLVNTNIKHGQKASVRVSGVRPHGARTLPSSRACGGSG